MTGEPPADDAVHVTLTWGLAPLAIPVTLAAVRLVGAAGTVAGTTAAVAVEAALAPAALVAVTVKVYVVPAVRPEVIVQVLAAAPDAVHVPPAGLEDTV